MNKQKNKIEKYFEKKWVKDGFTFTLKKQYISKTIYEVEKEGLKYTYELPSLVEDMRGYYRIFLESHSMRIEREKLLKELGK